MPELMPVCVFGHGVLLSPHCPCRIAHLDNSTLLVQPLHRSAPGALPPVAAVAPGKRLAHQHASPVVGAKMPTWQFGEDGPTITLGNGAEQLTEVFDGYEARSGQRSLWMLLGPGFMIDFPRGFTVDSATSPANPYFELTQAGDARDAIIQFQERPVPAASMNFPPDARPGTIDGLSGPIRFGTRDYRHEGIPWRQRIYMLPIADDATLVMLAQAPDSQGAGMLGAADVIACSFDLTRA